jgi:hypothetical protein
MKGLIGGSLFALILTASTTSIATPVKYKQLDSNQYTVAQAARNAVNVPHITNSGIKNNTHFIRVAVVGMSLEDLMISLPNQMERFNAVQITDQSGREIAAKTEITKERLSISFDKPVASGTSLEIQISGVQRTNAGGNILLYGLTAKRVGLAGDIPIGTARIDIPSKG